MIAGTLRADFRAVSVTLSSAEKGVTTDPICSGSARVSTAVLLNLEDVIKKKIECSEPKK
jgi:hypothetical protein